MAQELDDGEFWLPPQFLTDDYDMTMDLKQKSGRSGADKVFGVENGGGFGLFGLSRPNSDLSLTETESDEEEYLTGLTRKMANSSLNDDMWKVDNSKSWGMATSPQSTLCNVMGTSSRGSPTCPSPPAAGATNINDGVWDLLYAAAGDVPGSGFISKNRGLLAPSRKPSPISVPTKTLNPNMGFHSNNQALSYHQLQAFQIHQLKQQLILKQQQHHLQNHHEQMVQNRARNGPNNRPLGLSMSAWPTLQQSQQPQGQQAAGSGMRAVFLGNQGAKRESTGTGVFLPRQIGTQSESRKKRGGCSTVLLPDRVVQALSLNLDAMEPPAPPQPMPRIFTPDYEAEMRYQRALMATHQQQRRIVRQQPENELRLPQEWTY